MCLMAIVRRQWAENERLPFPLAQIQLSLLESPRPGQWLNGLMRSRIFWFGFAVIFALHIWNGGFRYFPKYIPEIPVKYNLSGVLANPPFAYTDWALKTGTLFFTVVGVTYFLNSSISFSIWASFIAMQIYKMVQGQLSGDPSIPGMVDQRFGGIVAFALAMIWIGRQHWKLVLAQAFRGERPDETVRAVFVVSDGVLGAGAVVCGIRRLVDARRERFRRRCAAGDDAHAALCHHRAVRGRDRYRT